MNISKYPLILALIGLIGLSACQQFEEVNLNPNEPTTVQPGVLMTSAIRNSMNTMVNESFLLGNNAGQLTAKTLRNEVDAYNWNAFPTVWEGLYGSLTDVKQVEELAVEAGNEQLQGAAITLRTWIFATLTNVYGDIPYTEAIQGDSANLTPAYDAQENIYADMLASLERAAILLQGSGSLTGDILLNNDATKWLRFTNSLRLRLLMTASRKLPSASTDFAAIVSEGNIMQSNADNAVLKYLNAVPNEFPLIPIKQGDFDAVALSNTALSVMEPLADPRLARFARPAETDYTVFADTTFDGAENGAGTCDKAGSRLGTQYWQDPNETLKGYSGPSMGDGIAMTYAEVEFLLAEAAALGWIESEVEAHYRAGVAASMEYYQVNVAPFGWSDFDDFYENSGVAYDEVTDIWQQKWIALFFTGLEPYFEVRRWYLEGGKGWESIPFMDEACDNVNGDRLPMRFLYPGQEQSLNAENYADAIARIGGSNNINADMWLTE